MIRNWQISIITLCAISFYGYSQSIFSNDITGSNPHLDNPYIIGQIVDPNISVNGIGRGSGLFNPPNTNDRYNARGWDSTTLDGNDYFEFTIVPNSGYEIDFVSFIFNSQPSNTGPVNISVRSSLNGYSSDIGTPVIGGVGVSTQSSIDLSSATYQDISTSITFRIYAWGGSNTNGTFSINDFIFNGTVSPLCSTTTTWDGSSWDNGNPNINKAVVLNGDYSTSADGGSFSACSLTINSSTLSIDDNDYIEVQNHLDTNGDIIVRPQGAFVQIEDSATVNASGNITVEKRTAPANNWYEYTYWSSPVNGATIANGLADAQSGRIFSFNAQNYLDATMEVNNDNTAAPGQDDVDDDNNAWQSVSSATVMLSGCGYASTHNRVIFESSPGSPKQFIYTFEGPFNNGIINVPLYRNDSETNDKNWNFIGNPYPSAIDADAFFTANPDTDGIIYLWSQNTPPSATANGNEVLNFSDSDYAIINSTGESAGGDGLTPSRFIPSGQGFFVNYSDAATPISTTGNISEGSVTFNNSMRVRGLSNNSQFFKTANSKPKTTSNSESNNVDNKLWIDLTSNNGAFNQILIGYVEGATNKFDGSRFDAAKTNSLERFVSLYSTIKGSDKKLTIQGKNPSDLTLNEKISLGFSTTIHVPTQYKLSINKLQGDFLSNNTIYLKDKVLNKHHDLSTSDYSFTSDIGEFNNRFEIVFKTNNGFENSEKQMKDGVKIFESNNGNVTFSSINDLNIKSVKIFDFLSTPLYDLKGTFNSKTFELSKLQNAVYIAKIEFSNGATITKKFIKK
ncbi:T9SS type A sorting domain-containing protein [Seonamhaeicola aphaedonensis]|uniref:Putative secreted protein (Por secretion system target) n=1 Tax=Seonamhaeicola aphaedonensis TaxID=1461338 RepID=A0A3D9HH17_9FLAO|nr:T9SS type A sorting domain-containing protein [Seonamhaeicola aphaedonensis]RED48778.1 putative secreted protein (Por secretion system target) [Seonamhaeicola aphaedonensis]